MLPSEIYFTADFHALTQFESSILGELVLDDYMHTHSSAVYSY